MRMIDDARAGKLDMIITKSITRFARNTVDSLMYLRILKEYNVDVYFEVENVHSLEANEMLLTILSSVAQQSSEDKSESIKWGYQRQFEKGKVYAANMYGYKSNRGTLDIIEEEAEVVREIFSKYLSIWHILRILCNNFFQKNLIIYCPNILTSHQRNIILG